MAYPSLGGEPCRPRSPRPESATWSLSPSGAGRDYGVIRSTFWPEPETDDPDRFLSERSADRPRFAWYPFLGGPHQCIGHEFAMMEMTLILAMIVQNVRLRRIPGTKVEPRPQFTLRPRDGLPMTIEIA
jgi:cytochrome P450